MRKYERKSLNFHIIVVIYAEIVIMKHNLKITEEYLVSLSNEIDLFDWSESKLIKLNQLKEKYNCHNVNDVHKNLKDIIRAKIEKFLSQEGDENAREFLSLISRSYNFKYLLDSRYYERYRFFIDNIYSWIDAKTVFNSKQMLKISSIKELFYELHFLNGFDPSKSHWNIDTRIINVVNAARKLERKYKLKYEIKFGDLFVENKEISRIGQKIENQIRFTGGSKVLQFILLNNSALGKNYNKTLHRFLIPLETSHISAKMDSATPYGYLFELCLKNLITAPPGVLTTDLSYAIVTDIIRDSRDLLCLLDIEPYSVWDTEFREGMSAIEMMGELNCLYHNLQFQQLSHYQINRVLSGLFSWIPKSEHYIDISKILEFTRLLTLSNQANGLILLTKDELKYRLNHSEELDEYIKIFAHKDFPNQSFNAPNEFKSIDSFFKPLIQHKNELYLPTRSWIGIPIYEAIFQYYLPYIDQFSSKMGNAMEKFITSELKRLGVKFYSGIYSPSKGIIEEVDFILEFKDIIIFIELKKKTLRRTSRAGDSTTSLIDLHKSLLDSQIQTLKHETHLLEKGFIEFKDKTILKYNNQQIERISLSLWELGFLQDKSLVKEFLKLYFNYGFTTPKPHEHSHNQKELDKAFLIMNQKCDQFRGLINKRHQYSPINLNIYFLSSWFLSIPQLLMLIDECNSSQDLPKKLKTARNITTKSLDFYFEYTNAKRIKGHNLSNTQMILPQSK